MSGVRLGRRGFLLTMLVLFAGFYVYGSVYGSPGSAGYFAGSTTLAQVEMPTAPSAPAVEAPATGMPAAPHAAPEHAQFKYFSFMTSPSFSTGERVALWLSLITALAALGYAGMLVSQVKNADKGTPKMQAIAAAVREGANAYLLRQMTVVGVLILALVGVLYASRAFRPDELAKTYAIGRAAAFFVGALFSATVGLVGMRMATIGNLRVAAAAPYGFGKALMFGYRSGTITGMLTDGLG
ncbi:MAG: sodium/proton-translocating pyrophosphatase, partial [Phycisphaeraceae bacterium]|nr:sodium/proton-translocating pyrophosphatase [Phycisphaeraceae bacterium]